MNIVVLLIMIALLQYIYFLMRVGLSRGKYNVPAPQTSGNETWVRLFRIQQNTMEQLVIFIPAILAFAYYVSAKWALLPGVLFIIGRGIYSFLYRKNPESRGPGMILSLFSNIAMVVGVVIAVSSQFT